jgi:hypothetical protein
MIVATVTAVAATSLVACSSSSSPAAGTSTTSTTKAGAGGGATTSGGQAGGAGGQGGAGGMGAGGAMMPPTVEPSADTKALLDAIKDHETWPKFDENSTPKLSKSHMNMWVVTYHNDVVTKAIADKTLPLPDGSILVKDNFAKQDDAMPMAVTVMSKQGGTWYWVEATSMGKVVVDEMADKGTPLEGYDAKLCVMCHSGAKDNDEVFTHQFK